MTNRVQLLAMMMVFFCTQSLFAQWQSLEGPYGSLIYDIYSNPSHVLLSTSDGVYRSTNGGAWWDKVAESFQENYRMVLLDANENQLLAMSGETVNFLPEKHLHVSTDNGNSWSVISLPDTFPSYFEGGAISGDHILLVGSDHIWESSDGGQSWFDSSLNGTITYADAAESYNGRIYVTGYGKIAISDVGGSNFTIRDIPPSAYILNIYVFDNLILLYDLAQERYYRSTNNGIVWVPCTPDNMGNSENQVVMFHDTLFTTNRGSLAYSTDQGAHWNTLTSTPSANNYVSYVGAGQGQLIVGTYTYGLLRSPSLAGPWTEATYGLHGSSVGHIEHDDQYLYAAVPYRGLYRYNLGTASWDTTLLYPASFSDAPDICRFNGKLYAAALNAANPFGMSVGRSADHGTTWTNITPQGNNPFGSLGVYNRIVNSDQALIVWGSDPASSFEDGFYLSTNEGNSWTEIGDKIKLAIGSQVSSIGTQGHTIWAATGKGPARSTDNGQTWVLKANGIPPNSIQYFGVNGIWGVDNLVFATVQNGFLYRSADNGENWAPASSGLPLFASTVDYESSINTIFRYGNQLVLISNGLYVSYDEGQHWAQYPGPLPDGNVRSAAVRNNQIDLGTYNRGMWVGSLDSFSLQPVTGRVFLDENLNGVQDGSEHGLPNVVVSLGQLQHTVTNAAGDFELYAYFDGADQLLKASSLGFPYSSMLPASYTVQSGGSGYQFALQLTPGIQDLGVFMIMAGSPHPGFESDYYLHASNYGTTNENARLELTLDPQLTLVESDPPASSVSGNVLRWDLNDFGYLDREHLRVRVKTPVGTPLGEHIVSTAVITPTDGNPDNNISISDKIVTGSFDPNEMTEAHEGSISRSRVNAGEPLVYTVHFQNTGTAAAQKVLVVNQLPALLDPSTIQILDASHSYSFEIRGEFLEITFDMIDLPDSASSQAGSQGYVRFSVQIRKEAPKNTSIYNYAYIYFDYNVPIKTPYAVTKIEEALSSVSDLIAETRSIRVIPNPNSGRFTLELPEGVELRGPMRVFARNGQLVWEGAGATVDMTDKASGSYFAVGLGRDGKHYAGKIIVMR